MIKPYFHPMLTQQAFERFGVRSFAQEHFVGNPLTVPPEVLLKSNVDVIDDVLGNTTAPEGVSPLATIEVASVEYEKPNILFEYRINGHTIKNPSKILQGVDVEFGFTFGSHTPTSPGTDPMTDFGSVNDTLVASVDDAENSSDLLSAVS